MKWQFTVILDTEDGAYDVQFRNLDEPGGRTDYDLIMGAVYRVLVDLDSRVDTTVDDAVSEHRGEEIEVHLMGDDALTDDFVN